VTSAPTGQHQTPVAHAILTSLQQQMPFLHKAALESDPHSFDERLAVLETTGRRLQFIFDDDRLWIDGVVKSYIHLSIEFLRLQQQLEKTGRYLLSSEHEAAEQVYHNEDVFGAYYLPGLLLTEALWPNHFKLNHAFKTAFLSQLPASPSVLEVGVGTGYHLSQLLTTHERVNYEGIDISQFAIDFCKTFAAPDLDARSSVDFQLASITGDYRPPAAKLDGIIMGEVLEHIETPGQVLEDLRELADGQTKMFITTVVFAANIDHIFMFEKVNDIRKLVMASGWRIENDWPLPIYPTDTPDMVKRPMNYGALLSKA